MRFWLRALLGAIIVGGMVVGGLSYVFWLLPRLVGWFTKDVAIPPSALGRG